MSTDVEGERALGEITRTAAGGAASLTIVWQEFRIQLCTTLLRSSSPLLSFPFRSVPFLPSCTFFLTIVSPSPLPHPSPRPPSLPFAKTTTYTWSGGLQSVSEGQVWCDSKWEEKGELFKLAAIHGSSTTQRHDERESGGRIWVKRCGEFRLYYLRVNTSAGPTDVVTLHRDKRSLFYVTSRPTRASVPVSVWKTRGGRLAYWALMGAFLENKEKDSNSNSNIICEFILRLENFYV